MAATEEWQKLLFFLNKANYKNKNNNNIAVYK